jgi:hypothetical protein
MKKLTRLQMETMKSGTHLMKKSKKIRENKRIKLGNI